jgi:hypothetical protein
MQEIRAHSSAWLERFADNEEVGGSSPPGPTQDFRPQKDRERNEEVVITSIASGCWLRNLPTGRKQQGRARIVDTGYFRVDFVLRFLSPGN